MRLVQSNSGGNFYEAFSDIIFATMAIFVLLMTIFVALIDERSPIKEAKRQLAELEQQIEDKKQEEAEIEAQSARLEDVVADLSKRDVEIFIIVDRSGSMEEELYQLKQAIIRLSVLLPQITDSVKIGVASYWGETYTSRDDIRVFPLSEIVDPKKDNGRSTQGLARFMNQQRHEGGRAPILKAAEMALSQFSSTDRFKGHQVLLILGDVGPYEEPGDSDVVTSSGRARAQRLISVVSSWAKASKNRNLIVLFSGRDEVRTTRYGEARRYKHQISQDLFKAVAQASGQPEAYTENQSTMLTDFLIAALKRK